MIRLIAIDLDGTLLDREKKISSRNRLAIRKAKEQGVKVVICTGRPLKAIESFLVELDLLDEEDYCVTFNGGLVQVTGTGEVLDKTALSLEQVQELAQLATKLALPLDILSEGTAIVLPTSPEHPSNYLKINPILLREDAQVSSLTEGRLYNKAVSCYDSTYLDRQILEIPVIFQQRYEIFKTRENLLEFMPKGVTKASALEMLGNKLQISAAEMMAIGDEENDASMIAYAGLGVAMENAVTLVKEQANVITDTNEADGVAKVIEKYVLNEGGH